MIAEIESAASYVHVEFYILVLDPTTEPFFQALARAQERGVAVRVLSDHLAGLMFPGRKETIKYLQDIGAEYHPMLPVRPWRGEWQRPDLRNHRKIVVVDGRVGFTGSQNLIDASYNKKRQPETRAQVARADGAPRRARCPRAGCGVRDGLVQRNGCPAAAGYASRVPNPGSALIDAQVLPSGPSFDNDNNLKLYATLIHKAERRVSITSPYFVPDESILMAIVTAAARGLSVELFVSEVGDQSMVYHAQRSYYEALLRAGVRIYLYRAPQVLHSKHFTIDEEVAVIGSSNMDVRSFSLNMEVSVLVHGRGFVDSIRGIEDQYRANSLELQLEDWLRRPVAQKAFDNLARLTASLQ